MNNKISNKLINISRNLLSHVLIIFIAFVIQTSIIPSIPFIYATPNLLLIIVFTYGLLYGEEIGTIVGIVCGFIFDMYFDEDFGVYILIYASLGYANGLLNNLFYGNNINFPMILSIINSFIFNLFIFFIHFLIRGNYNFLYCFEYIMIPNIIFTLVATIIIYKYLYKFNMLRDD